MSVVGHGTNTLIVFLMRHLPKGWKEHGNVGVQNIYAIILSDYLSNRELS